jgi:hypothetical protein
VTPRWLLDVFAGLTLVIAVNFAARLIVARRWNRQIHVEVNVVEMVMGVAMAGMLVPTLNVLPNGLWEGIFVGFAIWFLIRNGWFIGRHGWRGGDAAVRHHRVHYPLHIVMSFAMLYMYLAASPAAARSSDGMAMAPPTGTIQDFVGLPLVFAALLCVFAVWQFDDLSRMSVSASTGEAIVPDFMRLWRPRPRTTVLSAMQPAPAAQHDPLDRWLIERSLAPRLETVCLIAMSVVMAFSLILML